MKSINLKNLRGIISKIMICLCIISISSKVTTTILTSINKIDFDENLFNLQSTKITKAYSLIIAETGEVSIYDNNLSLSPNYIGGEDTLPHIEPMILTKDEYRMEIDDETYEVLLRIVEAEVTGTSYKYNGNKVSEDEMLLSKIRVAQVFMNRVEDDNKFSAVTNLYDALTQKGASSTLLDGRYYSVTVCDLTKEAVELALLKDTPDYTDGALFFNSCKDSIKYGDYLFTDSVGHRFFK